MQRNRRTGVGIIDFIGFKHKYGTHNVIRYLREGYRVIKKTNNRFNDKAGVPRSIRSTTMKPGGTGAKMAGRRSGLSYAPFPYILRRIRVQQNSSFYQVLHDANVPHEPDFYSDNTEVFEFPIKMYDNAKCSNQVSIWEQAANVILLQREFSDNSVSCTLMFKPKWILNRHLLNKGEIKKYLKFTNIYDINKDGILNEHFKIDLIKDIEGNVVEIKEYSFNPKHEEDDIEPVISMTVPLTKTLTILPHAPKGVYAQMPEEEISEKEYERRMRAIKPIDWSKLNNSNPDIMDDSYCSGESCIIK